MVKVRIYFGKHRDAPVRRQAKAQLAFFRLRDVLDMLVGVMPDVHRFSRTVKIDFAGGCRMPVGARSVKKLYAQLLLELRSC